MNVELLPINLAALIGLLVIAAGIYFGLTSPIERARAEKRIIKATIRYFVVVYGLPELEDDAERIAKGNIGWCFGEGNAPRQE